METIKRWAGQWFCDHYLRLEAEDYSHFLNVATCSVCYRQQQINDRCLDEIASIMVYGSPYARITKAEEFVKERT